MKKFLLLFVLLIIGGVSAFAQTHSITGKILDENGQGYPGAGISVKGTQLGTVSDVNGDFLVNVPDGVKNVLIIQAIGYDTRQIAETDGNMSIKLHAASKQLEGTVVTALGIRREKRDLGYSATTVNNEELTAGNNSSAISGLAGKVAGADITSTTGGPGGSTRIVLRGEKSISKDNNALMVVDGVIINNYDRTSDASGLAQVDFGNSANDLDPDEIESVTVLEGPAAAALYGAQGANGALIITTKKGRTRTGTEKNKMDITVKTTYTQSDVLKYPDYQGQFGQGAPGFTSYQDRGDNFSWGAPFTGQLQPWGQVIDGKQLVKPYSAISNPMRQFYDHGKDLNNFISLSGGSEHSTYYLSISALNSTGITPNTFYNKYSIRYNATTQLTNNFYSSVNINYINSYSRAEATGQSTGSIMQSLLQIPTDIPISPLKNLNNPFYSMQYQDASRVSRYGYFGAFAKNPFWVAENYDNRNKTSRIIGDINLGYKKGDFNIYNRVGIDATDDRSYYKTPYINAQSADQSIYYPSYPTVNGGGYQQNNYTGVNFYNDLIATYTHAFNSDFGIDALVGSNITMRQDEYLNANINPNTNGLVIPGFYNFTNNNGPVAVGNTLYDHRLAAIYADVKLHYRRELFLEMTGRNEWSSTLISGQNSYFYPGANAAWVFTERIKGDFKDKVLNFGKIRIGSAGVSHDAIPYANNGAGFTQGSITSAFGSIVPPFHAVPAYQSGATFGNQYLKPELTREYEIGTDLSFLKDRITVKFSYYNDLTHNLISAVPVPPSSGFAFNEINVGTISNKGEELSIMGTAINTKWGLKWDLFGTYTHNVSNVESLTGNVSQITLGGGGFQGMGIVAAVGHPYGTFYAADIQRENGHVVVDANTGLPVPSAKAQLLGSFVPKFQASWGTDLTYKGIKLHLLFTTKQGGQYYSGTKSLMDFVGSSQESTTNNRNPLVWVGSVNNISTTSVPQYVPNTTKYLPYNYWVTEVGQNILPAQNLVDASYIRLQEASISYKIPAKYYSKTPFGSLEASVFGNNLLLWTPKSNKYDDPEGNSSGAAGNAQGFNYYARASLRNYGISLKVTF